MHSSGRAILDSSIMDSSFAFGPAVDADNGKTILDTYGEVAAPGQHIMRSNASTDNSLHPLSTPPPLLPTGFSIPHKTGICAYSTVWKTKSGRTFAIRAFIISCTLAACSRERVNIRYFLGKRYSGVVRLFGYCSSRRGGGVA